MELIERLDAVRERWNLLEHPFYKRWSCGELSREELAHYAGEYRHAVVALAETATPGAQSQTSSNATADGSTRPATTTFFGDTGLWFVPTAEVLPHGKWSVSGYRRGTNYIQGYTNIGDFAGTFAVGIKDRAEIFGSFLVDTRIDRDAVPLFFNDPKQGGFIDRYPLVNQNWTGDNVGDLYIGAKINLCPIEF